MSNYPGAMDNDSTLYVSADNVMTTLRQPVAIGDNVIFVASSTGFAVNMVVTVNDTSIQIAPGVIQITAWEHMLITAIAGQAITVTRGVAGTTARAHVSGAVLNAFIDATHQQALKSSILQLQYWNEPVANIKGFGAKCDGVANDTAGFQAALAALPNGRGTIFLPAGTCRINPDTITIPGGVDVIGNSIDNTTLQPTGPGTALLKLNGTLGGPNSITVRNFTIDLSSQASMSGIDLTTVNNGQVERLYIHGGAYGIRLLNQVSQTHLRNLRVYDATTAGIYVNGDSCAEMFYDDIDIARVTAGTNTYGLQIARTTTGDVGAHYMKRVRVLGYTAGSGYVTYGIAVTANTSSDTGTIIMLTQGVFEQINGPCILLQKASVILVTNTWMATTAASAPTIQFDGSDHIYISNCSISNSGAGSLFGFVAGTPKVITTFVNLTGNRFALNTGYVFQFDATNVPAQLSFPTNLGITAANVTNDLTSLRSATSNYPNPPTTGMLFVGSCNISTGSGTPIGNITGNVGDLFISTAGGAGTTLYVKESGNGTMTGWVGK